MAAFNPKETFSYSYIFLPKADVRESEKMVMCKKQPDHNNTVPHLSISIYQGILS